MKRFFANLTVVDWAKDLQLILRQWPLTTCAAALLFASVCYSLGTFFAPPPQMPLSQVIVDPPQHEHTAPILKIYTVMNLGLCPHCNAQHLLIEAQLLEDAEPSSVRPGTILLIRGVIVIIDEAAFDEVEDRRIRLRARIFEQARPQQQVI